MKKAQCYEIVTIARQNGLYNAGHFLPFGRFKNAISAVRNVVKTHTTNGDARLNKEMKSCCHSLAIAFQYGFIVTSPISDDSFQMAKAKNPITTSCTQRTPQHKAVNRRFHGRGDAKTRAIKRAVGSHPNPRTSKSTRRTGPEPSSLRRARLAISILVNVGRISLSGKSTKSTSLSPPSRVKHHVPTTRKTAM